MKTQLVVQVFLKNQILSIKVIKFFFSDAKHLLIDLALKPPSRWNETKYGKSEINIAPEPSKLSFQKIVNLNNR